MATSDFSFRRDFKNIFWGPTLQYGLVRSVAAGLVWGVILLFSNDPSAPSGLAAPLFIPAGYFLIMVPISFVVMLLSNIGIPLIGIVGGIFALLIVVGDPLVWVLHKFAPQLVPVHRPGFVNFRLIIFVLPEMRRKRSSASRAPEHAALFEDEDETYMGPGGKGHSQKKEDFWGNEYIEHDDGSRSRKKEDFWGNEYMEHEDGSRSQKKEDFWGNEYIEHDDGSRSQKKEDFWGNEYVEHDDGSRSRKKEDWLGNEYWDHEE